MLLLEGGYKVNLYFFIAHGACARHCCTFFIVIKRIMNGHGRVKLTTQPDMSVFVSDYFFSGSTIEERQEREREGPFLSNSVITASTYVL